MAPGPEQEGGIPLLVLLDDDLDDPGPPGPTSEATSTAQAG